MWGCRHLYVFMFVYLYLHILYVLRCKSLHAPIKTILQIKINISINNSILELLALCSFTTHYDDV